MQTQPAEWVDFHVTVTWECHHCQQTGHAADSEWAQTAVEEHLLSEHADEIVGEPGRNA